MGTFRARSKRVTGPLPARCLQVTAGAFLLAPLQPCLAHSGVPMPVVHPVHNSPATATSFGHSAFMPVMPSHMGLSAPLASAPAGGAYNLDLASAVQNVMLGSKMFGAAQSVTINVGGSNLSFKPGQQVTAGEFIAIQEVLAHGPQTITLDAKGVASGGSFSLNQADSVKVSELLIPQGVTAVDNLSSNRSLTFAGDLINDGSIYGISTRATVSSGTIHAADISNGGLISTDLSGTAASGIHSASKDGDLTLTADHSLSNTGTVLCAGTLSLVTGSGDLDNSGTIKSGGNLNLSIGDGNFTNSGTVQSARRNIDIGTAAASTNLNIIAAGGSFSALSGNINIRDASYLGAANTSLNGGDYFSNKLNIYGGDGSITGSVGQVSGQLNTSGNAAHFTADTETLTLGANVLNGDPTFVNTSGNIVINGGVVAAEDITIIAAGNITASGNAYISTANATAPAGATMAPSTDITLIAGANVTVTTGNGATSTLPGASMGSGMATVTFGTGSGGNIDFSKSTFKGPLINTGSNLQGLGNDQKNGGDVVLAAFSTNATNGRILFPTNGTSISTSSLFGKSGSVLIVGANAAAKTSLPSISVGTITTLQDSVQGTGGGNVQIFSANPSLSAGSVMTFDNTGAITSANTIVNGSITAGYIRLTGGINAGNDTITINTNGGAGTNSGIIQTGTARLSGGTCALAAGILGLGSKTANILTAAFTFDLQSGSNVFINNLGPVALAGGLGGSGGTFQIITSPSFSGNGNITLTNTANISSSSGPPLALINLVSSGLAAGASAGISELSTFPLVATTVTLSCKGTGDASIGLNATPVLIKATNLSANTAGGDVFLNPLGSVNLLASSAENGRQFFVSTTPDATTGDGSITLMGKIQSALGQIRFLNIDSSENTAIVGSSGGIFQKVIGLNSLDLSLTDSTASGGPLSGTGTGTIGTAKSPIVIFTQLLTESTDGPTADIKDTGKNDLLLQGLSTVAGAANDFTVTSGGSIVVRGATAAQAITLTAGGSAGSVLVDGKLQTTGGTVTLTTAGSGSISAAAVGMAGAVTGSTVIFNAKNGGLGSSISPLNVDTTNLTANAPGFTDIYNRSGAGGAPLTLVATSAKNQFTLTSDSAITIIPAITKVTGIKIATTDVNTNQGITFNNSLGGSKTVSVELDVNSTGNSVISTANSKAILTSNSLVTIFSAGGDIGLLSSPIQVLTPNVSVNTNGGPTGSLSGGVVVKALALSAKTPTTVLNSQADGDLILTGTASLTLTNLQSVNGTLAVTISGALLQTAPDAVLAVGDQANAKPAASGSILLLQDTNTKSGSIAIGTGSNFSTDVVGKQGTITVEMGSPGAPQNQTVPAAFSFNTTGGGEAFFGANSIVAQGAAGNSTINVFGANLVFDTNGLPASRITVSPGVTFTADPVAVSAAGSLSLLQPTTPTPTSSASQTPTSNALQAPTSNSPVLQLAGTTAQIAPVQPTQSGPRLGPSGLANGADFALQPLSPASTGSALPGLLSSYAQLATTSGAISSINAAPSERLGWISATELSNGEIPALLVADEDFGISSDQSAIVDLDRQPAITRSGPLCGGVSNERIVRLNQGAAIFAPSSETIVKTSLGEIKVMAGSIVLVIASHTSTAVYDLHDTHGGAVVVSAQGKSISLLPGKMLMLAGDTAQEFAELNPAQLVAYRGITSHRIAEDLQAFTADYSMPHALLAVQPLKHFLNSKNPHCQRVANRLIKTTALVSEIAGRSGYQQVFRAQKTAWLH